LPQPRILYPWPNERFAENTQDGSPVRVSRTPGSVRVLSNEHPYRDKLLNIHGQPCKVSRIGRVRFKQHNTEKGFRTMKSDVENFAEGPLARAIEHQTAKLPSDIFLWAALASIGTSLALQILDRKKNALFVGQWAPTFLLLGIYNKLIKQLGSDRRENQNY
jgi:hypothetical protein